MVEFAGWHMPVQYESALREHLSVRSAVGLFDVSHMGELEVTGPQALAEVQKVTCNDLERISDGQAQYSAFLTPKGTFVDDIVVYRFSPERLVICVNAANKEKDLAWLQHHVQNATVADRSDDFAQIAVQGPRAEQVLGRLTSLDLPSIRYYSFAQGSVAGSEAIVSRTGYTGEDGFELYVAPEKAPDVWLRLLEVGEPEGIVSAGLAARNTLRLEVCFALYGNDIDESCTPYEAGLGWIVRLKKGDFVGRDALVRQKSSGITRRLVAFQLTDRGIARDHCDVFLDGERVGEVASAGYGPSVEKSIGMVYLPKSAASVDQNFAVAVRNKHLQARVVKKPFYSSGN